MAAVPNGGGARDDIVQGVSGISEANGRPVRSERSAASEQGAHVLAQETETGCHSAGGADRFHLRQEAPCGTRPISAPSRCGQESLNFSSGPAASVFAAATDQRLHRSRSPPQTFSCLSLTDSAPADSSAVDADATDLQPFRDALALSSLTTAASATVTSASGNRKNRIFAQFGSPNAAEELNAFMSEEFTRNMDSKKRSFPMNDVVMSSPTHKKPKFL